MDGQASSSWSDEGEFCSPNPISELRDLTRYRQKLIQQKTSELNRLQKLLEDANIKLTSVVSYIYGQSAQEMIRHLIQNDLNAHEMADLARRRLRSKLSKLKMAPKVTDHHRMLFKLSLKMGASYEEAIEEFNEEIDKKMEPYREISERLHTIP